MPLREDMASYNMSIACAKRMRALPSLSMALLNQRVVQASWVRCHGRAKSLSVAGLPDRALTLLDGDANRRTGNAVRGLRFVPPAEVLEQSAALADSARSLELFGVLAALQMQHARAATALQRHTEAATAARALVSLMNDGYVPDLTYTPEAWLVAAQALRAGQRWVRAQALPSVPAPFIDSFLHRNPVNRELLALLPGKPD